MSICALIKNFPWQSDDYNLAFIIALSTGSCIISHLIISQQESFGDIYIPEGFQPPQSIVLNKLSSKTGQAQSGAVTIADSKTIVIESMLECWKWYFLVLLMVNKLSNISYLLTSLKYSTSNIPLMDAMMSWVSNLHGVRKTKLRWKPARVWWADIKVNCNCPFRLVIRWDRTGGVLLGWRWTTATLQGHQDTWWTGIVSTVPSDLLDWILWVKLSVTVIPLPNVL